MPTTIKIKGMSCQHCVASVTKALQGLPELSDIHVDLAKGEARYRGTVDAGKIRAAITKIGFEVV